MKAGEQSANGAVVRRERLLWAMVQTLALLLLSGAYVVYAVVREQGPVYAWVAGTPVERACRRLQAALWQQQESLREKARGGPLLPEERRDVAPILERMARIRPTHAMLLRDGTRLFAEVRVETETELLVQVFDGQRLVSRTLPRGSVEWMKRIVVKPVQLTARDLRFLLRHPDCHPYSLPPYLFASYGDFATAHDVFLTLELLRDEFFRDFAPLLHAEAGEGLTHVCFFADEAAFAAEAASRGTLELVNARGFFREADNCLFLYDVPARDGGPGLGGLAPALVQVIRHEGAHLLTAKHQLLPSSPAPPVWLAEGLAQYCETVPFGAPMPESLTVLRRGLADHSLIPWDELTAMVSSPEARPGTPELEVVYAQAWLLFRELMRPRYHSKFMRYLAAIGSDPAQGSSWLDLMNAMETTPSKFLEPLLGRLPETSPKR